jgi:hypothetical protein
MPPGKGILTVNTKEAIKELISVPIPENFSLEVRRMGSALELVQVSITCPSVENYHIVTATCGCWATEWFNPDSTRAVEAAQRDFDRALARVRAKETPSTTPP